MAGIMAGFMTKPSEGQHDHRARILLLSILNIYWYVVIAAVIARLARRFWNHQFLASVHAHRSSCAARAHRAGIWACPADHPGDWRPRYLAPAGPSARAIPDQLAAVRQLFLMASVRFAVRLTPRAGREALSGWEVGADGKSWLKARVSAPPENGKANEALMRLIGRKLRVGGSCVRIVSGATARLKVVEVQGLAVLPPGFGEEG